MISGPDSNFTKTTISSYKGINARMVSSSFIVAENSSSSEHYPKPSTPVSKKDDYDAALVLASIRNVTKVGLAMTQEKKSLFMPSIPDLECYFQRAREKTSRVPKLRTAHEVTEGAARIRAVSLEVQSKSTGPNKNLVAPNRDMVVVSPPSSPYVTSINYDHLCSTRSPKNVDRRKRYLEDRRLSAEFSLPAQALDSSKNSHKKPKPSESKSSTSTSTQSIVQNTSTETKKTITLHKKFSWRSCPELENFLIEHREEYLHYSCLNYTMEQKNYNNKLTQSLIDLATTIGYSFDPAEFNFVQVRDRIRCYFKSYVQSRKKRGISVRQKKS